MDTKDSERKTQNFNPDYECVVKPRTSSEFFGRVAEIHNVEGNRQKRKVEDRLKMKDPWWAHCLGLVENKGHSIPVCHLRHRAQLLLHSLGLRLCNFLLFLFRFHTVFCLVVPSSFPCFPSSCTILYLRRFVVLPLFYVHCILSSTRSFHLIGRVKKVPRQFQLIRAELPSNPSQSYLRVRSSKLPRLSQLVRGLVNQAECSSNLLVTPATTTAKGLSHRLPLQVHSLRHRRRRGTYSAPAEESATTAIRLYGALASAYLLSEVPLLVSLRLRFYFWFMRALVHVRRARRCPSSDTTLNDVLYVAYAAPLTPRVLPHLWIPVGD